MATSAISYPPFFAPAPSPVPHHRSDYTDLVIGIGTGIFFFLLLVVLVLTQNLRKINWHVTLRSLRRNLGLQHKIKDEDLAAEDPEIKLAELKLPSRYTFKNLYTATKGFSPREMIGSGGFGQVYRATLQDGSTVAVKKIFEQSERADRQFVAELTTIGRISHRNLVQLKGWCLEKGKMLLVYDYMPNGSLEKYLFGSGEVLAWPRRYEIAKGVAAGLFYLHEGWEKQIVHNDVKPSNVLLDWDFNPRLSDFGLARLVDDNKFSKTMSLAGTLGYVAPELGYSGKSSEKTDVYSFGMLLLTTASGKSPLDETLADGETLLNMVWRLQAQSRLVDAADSRMSKDYNETELGRILQLGLICCYPYPDSRPTMRYCNQVLLGDIPIPALATSKPALFYPILQQLQTDEEGIQLGNSPSSSGRLKSPESSTAAMLSRTHSFEIVQID